ncbi:MAG: hypothetical protein WCT31_02080 [Candidatus Micrarchaeia archaeon]
MCTKKFFISGFVSGIVILVISFVLSAIFQSLFSFNMLSLAGMRSVNDPVMILFFLYPFVLGFVLTYLYSFVSGKFKGTIAKKALGFGTLAWIVLTIPSSFMVFSSMDYPLGFYINSVVGSLIYLLAGCFVIVSTNE